MSMWARRDIDEVCAAAEGAQLEEGRKLRRELGLWHLTLAGVGSAIGSGIFVLTGTVAAQYAGPSVALSCLVAALVCLCTALCYGEMAGMMPASGGVYSYTSVTMGQLAAWMIGWCLVLEYLAACATVAVGWSSYFTGFVAEFGISLPARWSQAPLTFSNDHQLTTTGAFLNLPAIAVVTAIGLLLIVGVRQTARANVLMVGVKVGVILLVVGFGIWYVRADNLLPFVPENRGSYGAFGWSGVFRGAAVMFFAYVGFDGISTSAQEARNPQRDLGRGILLALLICTILYVAMSIVVTGLAPFASLNVAAPVIVALGQAPELGWLRPVVGFGVVVGLASAILMGLYGQTRIFYAMAGDRLLPDWFRTLNRRFCTPHWGTVVVVAGCALLAGLFPVDILGELVSFGALLAFILVCAGVLILRRRDPDRPRPFRVPYAPMVPLLGMAGSAYLILSLPPGTWVRLLVWMTIGTAIYFGYGRRHAAAAG